MADQKKPHGNNQEYSKKILETIGSFEILWEKVRNPSDTNEKHKDDLVKGMKKMQVLDKKTNKEQNEDLLVKDIKKIKSLVAEIKKLKSNES